MTDAGLIWMLVILSITPGHQNKRLPSDLGYFPAGVMRVTDMQDERTCLSAVDELSKSPDWYATCWARKKP
jgi:hypothetical protein